MTTTEILHETVAKIARQRDRLNLKIHLAAADAKAEWERAEAKWNDIQAKMDRAKDVTDQQVDSIRKSVADLTSELAKTYHKLEAELNK